MREETVYLDSGACEHYMTIYCGGVPTGVPKYGMVRVNSLLPFEQTDGYVMGLGNAGYPESIKFTVKHSGWSRIGNFSLKCGNLWALIGKERVEAEVEVKEATQAMIQESIELSYNIHGGLREALVEPFVEAVGGEVVLKEMARIEKIDLTGKPPVKDIPSTAVPGVEVVRIEKAPVLPSDKVSISEIAAKVKNSGVIMIAIVFAGFAALWYFLFAGQRG